MDTDLAMKLTEIVKEIGDTKYEIMSEVSNCKREVALVKQKLTTHMKEVEGIEVKKQRVFDKKTVIISLVIGLVTVVAVFK